MSSRSAAVLVILVLVTLFAVGISFRGRKLAPTSPERTALTLEHPKGYVCYRTASAITVDGKLDDEAWKAAPWSDDFVDIEGDRRPKPRFRTRVKMLWDDHALYIAAELDEPHVWATLTQHDSVIFHDNDFEVFLDPDGDNHLYGELELNALNTTWDLLLVRPYKDGGPAINAWEITGLQTAVHIHGTLNEPRDTDRGWTVEIAWPWPGLKELCKSPCPPRDGDQWRINFSRVQWEHEIVNGRYRKTANRREDNWVWAPQGEIDMHRPERWGYLQFSNAVPGSAQFQPDPSAAARELLHRFYWAQRQFHQRVRRYALSFSELGEPPYAHDAVGEPSLHATTTWYDVTVPFHTKTGTESLRIRADRRIDRVQP